MYCHHLIREFMLGVWGGEGVVLISNDHSRYRGDGVPLSEREKTFAQLIDDVVTHVKL